jgi:lipopolysaccharide assembly protein A
MEVTMLFFLILALILIVLVVIFAAQNMVPVIITLFAWKITTNISVAMLCAAALGALIVMFLMIPGDIRNQFSLRSAKKKVAQLEAERDSYIASSETAKKEVKELEEQLASYTAVLENKMVDDFNGKA